MLQRSRQLEAAARSGRQVPEYEHEDIRELIEPPYRLIYVVLADRIDILTVMHTRQLLPADLADLRGGAA